MTVDSAAPSVRRQLVRWWGWWWLATVAAALLCAVRYFAVVDFDASPGALVFRALMLTAHMTTLCLVALTPVLLLLLLAPRPKLIIAVGGVWVALVLLVLLVDTQVYQLYRFHLNAGVMNLLFGGAAAETFVFSGEMYLQSAAIAIGVLAASIAVSIWLWRRVQRSRPRRGVAWALASAAALVIVSFHVTHMWADVLAYEPILEQTDVLPLRYAATAKRFLRKYGVETRARPEAPLHRRAERSLLSYPLEPLRCTAPEPQRNLVFILIDSWRFDEMNAQVTPHAFAFSRRTVRFLDHHSGGNATRIGVFSLFYAIPGTYWHRMLNERQGPVFVDQLLAQGYDVQVFRSTPLYSPEFDRTVFAALDQPRMRSDGRGPADFDADLTRDFLAYLEQRTSPAPFFALLFYDSPHAFDFPPDRPLAFTPSAPEVNYLALHGGADKTPLLNRYRNSVHYVDSLVGQVLNALEKKGLMQNTVIVVTGDHGQEFNDNGRNFWGHNSNYSRYQTGVPLLLYAPDLQPRVVHHRTTHFDVAPTLMQRYLGCDTPLSAYTVGRPLFEPNGREPLVFSEYNDFAILHGDRIAVVRDRGLQVFSPDYKRLNVGPEAAAIQGALEQNTRFYKGTRH